MYPVPSEDPDRWLPRDAVQGCTSVVLGLLCLAGLAGLIPYWIMLTFGLSDSGSPAQWQAWESFWASPYRLIDAVLLGALMIWLIVCTVRGWRFREIALNLGFVLGCYLYMTLAPFLW
jgi:hypothetical protein